MHARSTVLDIKPRQQSDCATQGKSCGMHINRWTHAVGPYSSGYSWDTDPCPWQCWAALRRVWSRLYIHGSCYHNVWILCALRAFQVSKQLSSSSFCLCCRETNDIQYDLHVVQPCQRVLFVSCVINHRGGVRCFTDFQLITFCFKFQRWNFATLQWKVLLRKTSNPAIRFHQPTSSTCLVRPLRYKRSPPITFLTLSQKSTGSIHMQHKQTAPPRIAQNW